MCGSPVDEALRRAAGGLPGHEDRPSRAGDGPAVAAAIREHRHLIVQAGTGTGKSLAYLVPALVLGTRAVVSTATKALQDQLAHRDLPLLVRQLDERVEFAVLKGAPITPAPNGSARSRAATSSSSSIRRRRTWCTPRFGTTRPRDTPPPSMGSHRSHRGPGRVGLGTQPDGLGAGERRRPRLPRGWALPVGIGVFAGSRQGAGLDKQTSSSSTPTCTRGTRHRRRPPVQPTIWWSSTKPTSSRTSRPSRFRLRDQSRPLPALARQPDPCSTTPRPRWRWRMRPRRSARCSPGIPARPCPVLCPTATRIGWCWCASGWPRSRPGSRPARRSADDAEADLPDQARHLRTLQAAGHLLKDLDEVLDLPASDVAWVEGAARARAGPRGWPLSMSERLAAEFWGRSPTGRGASPSATIPPRLGERLGLAGRLVRQSRRRQPFAYDEQGFLLPVHLPTPAHPSLRSRHARRAAGPHGGSRRPDTCPVHELASHDRGRRRHPGPLRWPFSPVRISPSRPWSPVSEDEHSCLFATMGFWQGVDVPGSALSMVAIDRLPFP